MNMLMQVKPTRFLKIIQISSLESGQQAFLTIFADGFCVLVFNFPLFCNFQFLYVAQSDLAPFKINDFVIPDVRIFDLLKITFEIMRCRKISSKTKKCPSSIFPNPEMSKSHQTRERQAQTGTEFILEFSESGFSYLPSLYFSFFFRKRMSLFKFYAQRAYFHSFGEHRFKCRGVF